MESSVILREPFSSLSHWLGFVAALYLTGVFWRLTRGDWLRRYSVLCFGGSMVLLYGASGAYHAVVHPEAVIDFCRRLDHSAIYVLIAGTYTPIFAVLLRGRWRTSLLATMWGLAVVGVALKWLLPLGPHWLSVVFYIAMGWLGVVPVVPLTRAVGLRAMALGLLGGLFYTTGAVIDTLDWPVIYSPLIRSHEVMHLCDLAGTATHVVFVIRYVVPYPRPPLFG
jgi:hemolysin III